ncbi:1-phosphatidylinositol 4,5-bisphosphate phosphodiesterase eta-1 isoform X2 [Polypterus senegalus]|uniref:1-phosphatidylinositol 4,5-bisphosphate phosphodiesterase eta-1 isoform X2 n=1 Tax=Polypterus senegalus TaxID=55291 RepID=UPI001965290C|nr:1-phosphatidylinositol 4,5-bisphosphate phosphodiesterase eta-1 isoform X2 [Polypterus senegalus]
MSSRVADRKRCLQYCRHFLTDNSLFHIERCMSVMQSGTQMVKLKNGSKGLVRLFYLDEHRTCIRWRPSRKSEKAKIIIDSLYKVTEGQRSEIFHRHADGNFDPSCCFTIYHGNHMESLDLVTTNPEEARTWITGLKYLMAGISDEDSLAKRQRTHDQWMKQTFEEADKNGDGLLNIEEIYQLLHKMNVNLPRRKVKQMFQAADTDEQQGTLTFEEFSVFYKMMSLRRDLFLLLMCFSDKKDHLTADDLAHFLKTEQKMVSVTPEYCLDIINKFEVCEENKAMKVLSVEGFTNFMRSPDCDVFNPLHYEINQDMDQPLCNYFIASSHNTYLTGDQLLSNSKTDMYAWVLQAGCRCVEVDCWDGPDNEPVVQHGYTLTSKILFKDVIETINKYAFVKNEYPVILSIENHCSIPQQKKIAQYLKEILGEKLDLEGILARDSKQLPSPNSLKGKILIKGKRLPSYLAADAEEGEVSDDDSADEIEDDFKLKHCSSNDANTHQVESFIRKKLDSLLKESQIGDKEDSDSFTIRALLKATHEGLNLNLKKNSHLKETGKKSHSRSLISSFSKHKKNGKSRSKSQSTEGEEAAPHDVTGKESSALHRTGWRRKTIKLSRDLSELVVFTNSVASQDILEEGNPGNVLSFSETRAHQLVHHKPEQFILFNQKQLTRIYPSAYRIDSSNFNPQTYWNIGCQLVALNYQTEGRMMQLNRAKFMVNGNSGYVLKPPPMCKDDPLPAYPKKQLVLKIISGQQLPKPPDSMLGDRGEIIDPFVEVEIIGLPVDCCKEQTRVVDDNGFNPVWEETLTFTLHLPELALVRFLVWDHDPIGRDFVGQRTVAFTSLMPGYRHVYLEGLTEASIFIHVMINDIYGKWSPLVLNPSYTIMHLLGASKGRQLRGLKGLFNKSPKNYSVDTSSGFYVRKRSIGDHLLRRTASAPAKGRKKTKMGFAENSNEKKESEMEGQCTESTGRRKTRNMLVRPASMPADKLLELSSSDYVEPFIEKDTFSGSQSAAISSNICQGERMRSASVDLLIETSSKHFKEEQDLNKCYGDVAQKSPTHPVFENDQPSYLEMERVAEKQHAITSQQNKTQGIDGFPSEHVVASVYSVNEHQTTKCLEYVTEKSTPFLCPSTFIGKPLSSISESDVPPTIYQEESEYLTSSSTIHDSVISRLIDAVSSDNETDVGNSISALIDQLDTTDDKTVFTAASVTHEMNKYGRRFSSDTSNLKMNSLQKHSSAKRQTANSFTSHLANTELFSTPETSELSLYTILNEEVISPVYNRRDIVRRCMEKNSEDNTPVGSSYASPVKLLSSESYKMCDKIMGPQEIYSSDSNITLSNFLMSPDSFDSSLMEIEVNVDDDSGDHLSSLSSKLLEDLTFFPKEMQSNTIKHNCLQPQPERNATYNLRQQSLKNARTWNSNSCYKEYQSHVDNRAQPSNSHGDSYEKSAISGTLNASQCRYSSCPSPENIISQKNVLSHCRYQSSTNKTNCNSGLYYDYHKAANKDDFRNSPVFNSGHQESTVIKPSNISNLSHCQGYNACNQNSETLSSPQFLKCTAPNTRHKGLDFSKTKTDLLHAQLDPLGSPSNSFRRSSPCKSKSLGDLTSEDISCNFESKYKYISKSFVTPSMGDRRKINTLSDKTPSVDPFTEQLRKLVSFEHEDSCLAPTNNWSKDEEDLPSILSRKLSSRSQSRVRHIASRSREKQEANKQKLLCNYDNSGVVLRNKPLSQHLAVNRHSTGSYIAGYLNHINGTELEDRGLPEGACTSLNNGCRDSFYTDVSVLQKNCEPPSEPEIYFLLRL